MPRNISRPFFLLLFGAPGSGKGTYASLLVKKLGLCHLSMGDLIRKEIKTNPHSSLALSLKTQSDAGQLISDDIVASLLQKEICEYAECKNASSGVILDGFPRNLHQAEMLEEILRSGPSPKNFSTSSSSSGVNMVIELQLDDDVILQKTAGRRLCSNCGQGYNVCALDDPARGIWMPAMPSKKEGVCDKCGSALVQRADDRPEVVQARLDHYYAQTRPILDWYHRRSKDVWVTSLGVSQSIARCGDPLCALVQRGMIHGTATPTRRMSAKGFSKHHKIGTALPESS